MAFPSTNPILDRLVRAGILTRLRRDRYALTEELPARTRKIANDLVKPSALSLWTSLSDAGVTTQVPRVIQSVTPARSTTIDRTALPSFQYVHLPPSLFFGMQLDTEGVFRMPPEKAILDLLYFQHGAIDWESIDARRLDATILERMAQRFPQRIRDALASSPLAR